MAMVNYSLRDAQYQMGAVFAEDSSVPIHYGNSAAAMQAVQQTVAICDRSHWGRIQVTGRDRQAFLHNQSTNDISQLQPGQGCDTVIVTSTARTIDLVTAYISAEAVLVLTAPARRTVLMTWFDRYIFFGDQVALADVTEQTFTFSLIGPGSHHLLETLGWKAIMTQPEASHTVYSLESASVQVAVGSGLALQGYTIIGTAASSAVVWKELIGRGSVPMGDHTWEQLRILQGRPMPDRELTEDYNPLEAGLWQAVSFSKGCYIGQETIARLDTYKGVKQRLWGIQLESDAEPGTPLTVEGEKVGVLTSITKTDLGWFGLGYVRSKVGETGLTVQVGHSRGLLVTVPFIKHDRP
jgi:hypothetical protein